MKALLALVLFCFFVFMVEGREQGAPEDEPCTRAEDALEYFVMMRSCASKRAAKRISRQLSRTVMSNNLTVEGLQDVLATYCSTVFSARIQCFRGHVQNCSDDQQKAYLNGVLEQTGFICQPNTTNTHPYFNHLLQRLTDEDLQLDEDCFTPKLPHIGMNCLREAITSLGWTPREFSEFWINATVQEFIPYVSRILNGMFECSVREIREDPNRCVQWQGLAMKYVTSLLLMHYQIISVLGNTMTFTQAQLLQMFELDELQAEGSMEGLMSVLRGV